MRQFNQTNFHALCNRLAATDKHLHAIVAQDGYPPLWTRPNTFETLVLTILEQQVSLASAYAAYQKLKAALPVVTPTKFLSLNDDALRNCSFSRQKMVYVRELAHALLLQKISLKKLAGETDEAVREKLTALKGIGNWTVDMYLLHALQRTDVFPIGDLALLKAVQMITGKAMTKEEMLVQSEAWRPFRSIATMILWHHYLCKKKLVILH